MKKVLFVCRFNKTRSQIAAGFFNKYCPKRIAVADSAGLFKCDPPLTKKVKDFAKKHKLKLSKPKGLERELVNAQDIFVIVANDVPPSIFSVFKKRGKKVIVWKIKDLWNFKDKKLENITPQIEKKARSLVDQLSKEK